MNAVSSIVGERDLPESVRALVTLDEPDYVDVFIAEAPTATTATAGTSAEDWARAILERAPVSRRNARRFWRLMGLRLGPRSSPDHVQGWKIAAGGDNWVRLETGSWYLTAQAVCLVEDGRVSLSLSVRYDRRHRRVAALVWSFVEGPHQRAVPVMLHQAVKLMTP